LGIVEIFLTFELALAGPAHRCEKCLRTLLIHLACGYSLRETGSASAHLAQLSDVAFAQTLAQKQGVALRALPELFEEANLASHQPAQGRRIRLVDATHVKEAGKTGSVWRIHYSLSWPSAALRLSQAQRYAWRG
jgi:hypothetical protein